MIDSANKSSICFLYGQTEISVVCENAFGRHHRVGIFPPSLPHRAPSRPPRVIQIFHNATLHFILVTFQMFWPLSTTNCGGFSK